MGGGNFAFDWNAVLNVPYQVQSCTNLATLGWANAGSTDKSYGIQVARLAGVPGDVLDRADAVLKELENRHLEGKESASTYRRKRKAISIFLEEFP